MIYVIVCVIIIMLICDWRYYMNFDYFEKNNIVKFDFPLSNICTMRTGGNAKYAFFPESKQQLIEVISFLRKSNIKFKILGNGSNVIFKDDGYDGAVVVTVNMRFIFDIVDNDYRELSDNCELPERLVYVSAGYSLTSLAAKLLRSGYTGLEFAYGIPASIGGAVFMNAGAYGGEMKDVIQFVEYLSPNGEILKLDNTKNDCNFSYRHSYFTNHPEYIIIGAALRVCKANGFDPMQKAEMNMKSRKEKQPLEFPSCGSAFKRPEGHYAGALIEKAGLKGFNVGGAYVSEKHAGFIINKGGATTSDVIELINHVRKTVYEMSNVMLEPEINIVED